MKSANFSSWSGSAWTSTLAHDLAGISYDLSGNLTALQRYRETATLVDNLTYINETTSNRLTSITDAVSTTAETWDAETGSFTYDANGSLLTAPAPYSISAVSYDPANLPLSLTRLGTTTTYRYDDAGHRITKQVGNGNTDVYVRDGAITAGVFTVDAAGAPQSWHFNVLWEDRVIGRQPNAGTRRHYHFDHLGTTRAVVQSATVVESYDYEPWGLLMPGRALAGPTREGFTSKERDIETGLDYFGARHYMPAIARWTSVDPLSDNYPEWSSYHYVRDNPLLLVDPDGRQWGWGFAGADWPQLWNEGIRPAIDRRVERLAWTLENPGEALRSSVEATAERMICLPCALTDEAMTTADALYQAGSDLASGDHERQNAAIGEGIVRLGEYAVAYGGLGRAVTPRGGIIYRRLNLKTGLSYIGRTKSEITYAKRKVAHDQRYGVRHQYTILARAKPGLKLRVREEDLIRQLGGPGKLANKRFELNEKAYRDAGGKVPRP